MKLPNLNMQKYISNADALTRSNVSQSGDQVYFYLNLYSLPGNLGKYFQILNHFYTTHIHGIKETPATVILDADIITKTETLISNFNDSLRLENTVYDIGYRNGDYVNLCCKFKDLSINEARSLIVDKFIEHILIPLEEILKGNEPLLLKTIIIKKHNKELFSFSVFWFETKVTYNIINNTDFRSEIIDNVNDLFSKFIANYNENYKDAYKLYEHFETFSYGQKNIAKEMVSIFDILIVTSECEELEVNTDDTIAISNNNSSSEQISTYNQVVLGNKYQNNIIGKGNISTKMLVEAAKKVEKRNLQNQFTTYISQLCYK